MVCKVTPSWTALWKNYSSLVLIPEVSHSVGLRLGLGCPFNMPPGNVYAYRRVAFLV